MVLDKLKTRDINQILIVQDSSNNNNLLSNHIYLVFYSKKSPQVEKLRSLNEGSESCFIIKHATLTNCHDFCAQWYQYGCMGCLCQNDLELC